MEPLTTVAGRAYPFGMANCDTDVIIAAEWLKTTSRTGLGKGAFAKVRQDGSSVFDDPRYADSPILVAGANFGCGSSREHAAWALADMGLRVVIAPSFSDIFSGNAFRNGILTACIEPGILDDVMSAAWAGALAVDLAAQTITAANGESWGFAVDPFRKACLLDGVDEIGLTLGCDAAIGAYEAQRRRNTPWHAPRQA